MINSIELGRYSIIGITLIVLGVFLVILGVKSLNAKGYQTSYDGFGLVLIGPFPIILGISNRFKLLTVITVLLTVILLLIFASYYT